MNGLFGLAWAGTDPALALGVDVSLLLVPEGRAQVLRRFVPAGGPLQRHASRPGAWYALLELPVAPGWPMQLLMWPDERHHEIRLFALDSAPDEAPTVVAPLPLELERGRGGRNHAQVSHFMLPAGSTARTIFVLVEQWRIDGEAPAPLRVQLLARRALAPVEAPWWSTGDGRDTRTLPPPSPLTQQQQQRGSNTHEVPIFSTPAMPGTGVWR